jgi:HK97 gp10 family phage protein
VSEDVEVEVTGLAEMAETLDKIPYVFAQRIQRAALLAGGEVFMNAAQSLAPVASEQSHKEGYPGELRDSIGVVVKLGKDLDMSVAQIGPLYEKSKYNEKTRTHSPGVYGKFVEYGTAKMRAHPFLRPAFHAVKEQALKAYAEVTGSLLHLLVQHSPKALKE